MYKFLIILFITCNVFSQVILYPNDKFINEDSVFHKSVTCVVLYNGIPDTVEARYINIETREAERYRVFGDGNNTRAIDWTIDDLPTGRYELFVFDKGKLIAKSRVFTVK